MKQMKRYQILLIIILVLLIILGIKIYNSNKQPEYTSEEIRSILEKSAEIDNYQVTVNGYTYKRKGKLVLEARSNTDTILIRDYENQKKIDYSKEKKICITMQLNSNEVYNSNQFLALQTNDFIASNSTYIKTININDLKCIKLKCNWITDNNAYLYVDVATGLIIKIESDSSIEQMEINYSFNTVTDEDFKLPDLSDYKVIDT